jgi:hypothetical protein
MILFRLAFLATAALLVGTGCAQSAQGEQARIVVVIGGRAAERPALIAQVRAAAGRAHVQLRVPRTPTEELGVTHLLAAQRYDAVIAVDLDRRVAVDPVAQRYPHVRFVAAPARMDALQRALADAAH